MEQYRVLERACLRKACGVKRSTEGRYCRNQDLYDQAKVIRIDNFLMRTASRFIDRMEAMDNSLIVNLRSLPVGEEDRTLSTNHLKKLLDEDRMYSSNGGIVHYNGRYSGAQFVA